MNVQANMLVEINSADLIYMISVHLALIAKEVSHVQVEYVMDIPCIVTQVPITNHVAQLDIIIAMLNVLSTTELFAFSLILVHVVKKSTKNA
jgi:hypothetical protein